MAKSDRPVEILNRALAVWHCMDEDTYRTVREIWMEYRHTTGNICRRTIRRYASALAEFGLAEEQLVDGRYWYRRTGAFSID